MNFWGCSRILQMLCGRDASGEGLELLEEGRPPSYNSIDNNRFFVEAPIEEERGFLDRNRGRISIAVSSVLALGMVVMHNALSDDPQNSSAVTQALGGGLIGSAVSAIWSERSGHNFSEYYKRCVPFSFIPFLIGAGIQSLKKKNDLLE